MKNFQPVKKMKKGVVGGGAGVSGKENPIMNTYVHSIGNNKSSKTLKHVKTLLFSAIARFFATFFPNLYLCA